MIHRVRLTGVVFEDNTRRGIKPSPGGNDRWFRSDCESNISNDGKFYSVASVFITEDGDCGSEIWTKQVMFAKRILTCPVSMIRVGGIPLARSVLPAGRTMEALEKLTELKRLSVARRTEICDGLGGLVTNIYAVGKVHGRTLLTLKRDIYNGRVPRCSSLELISEHIPELLLESISQLSREAEQLHGLEGALESAFWKEVARGWDLSIEATSAPDLLRAIEVTNLGVYRRLSALINGSKELSPKALNQTRLSATRYMLRAGQKTSPLSSFGIVALGHSTDDRPTNAIADPMVRRAEPNYGLLDFAGERALSDLANLADDARISVNGSATVVEGAYEWRALTSSPIDHRVRQGTMTIGRSASKILLVLARLFAASDDGTLRLDDLRRSLATRFDSDKVEVMLAQAWKTGFLLPFLTAANHPVETARARCQLLAEPLRSAFGNAQERFIICSRDTIGPCRNAEAALSAYLRTIGEESVADRARPVVFEDCIIPERQPAATATLSHEAKQALQAFLKLIPILSADSIVSRTRRFATSQFIKRYGRGGRCDHTLAFINECAADLVELVGQTQGEAPELLAMASAGSPAQTRLHLAREDWFDGIADRCKAGTPVDFALERAEAAFESVAHFVGERPVSAMFFVQTVLHGGRSLVVLNKIYPGACATMSRFIQEGDAFEGKVAEYLRDINGEARYAELSGTFGFNAAAHPRFTDYTISIPPFAPSDDRTTNIDDLTLAHRSDMDDLVFVNGDGKQVAVCFTAILNPLTMPPQFQIVRSLSPWTDFVGDLSEPIARRLCAANAGLVFLPRVSLGPLILVRARHIAPRAILPDPSLPEHQFFQVFNHWADHVGMPRHLYFNHNRSDVRMRENVLQGSVRPAQSSHKPMPLDRWAPLAVLLLQKEVAANNSSISFVEALPRSDQTSVTLNGDPVTAEYGVELTAIPGL